MQEFGAIQLVCGPVLFAGGYRGDGQSVEGAIGSELSLFQVLFLPRDLGLNRCMLRPNVIKFGCHLI